ncbi:MAG: hypothetical protein GF421_07015 [Candidatus Aminicenantes bacterium]|nr:hypothetical protein [Candidatus Aminicenantes bacterium]
MDKRKKSFLGMIKHRKKWLYFLPAFLYYALIFFLSSRSYQTKVEVPFFDKFLHLLEFAGLGFLLSLGFYARDVSLKSRFGLVFSIGLILSGLDELHQFFVPMRYMDGFDLIADMIGVITGFFVFIFISRKLKWNHSRDS